VIFDLQVPLPSDASDKFFVSIRLEDVPSSRLTERSIPEVKNFGVNLREADDNHGTEHIEV
jgi:hypothetical protein